jgi:hypothetical protein
VTTTDLRAAGSVAHHPATQARLIGAIDGSIPVASIGVADAVTLLTAIAASQA